MGSAKWMCQRSFLSFAYFYRMKSIKLVATDLDGTFLNNNRSVSPENHETLHWLGSKNVARVAATGRNLTKVREVISDETPFDFIVFSSGAGVYDWNQKKHIYSRNIGKQASMKMMKFLVNEQLNFHVFFPVPENHKHWFYRGNKACEEFERYFIFNKAHSVELNTAEIPDTEVCQFLVIIPEDVNLFNELREKFEAVSPELRVIRSSSPLTKGYIWIEIFHRSVSKGNAVKHLCALLEIDRQHTFGIGNDYNDIDLLEFTNHSVVVENAPDDIKKEFAVTNSNEENGFAKAVRELVK